MFRSADLQPAYYRVGEEKGAYPKSVIINENADIIVAQDKGFVAGLIHVSKAQTPPFDAIVPHQYARFIDFIVTAAFRKQGIGTALLNAAKEGRSIRKLDYIKLMVLSNAKDEKSFYENQNFTVTAHVMRYM